MNDKVKALKPQVSLTPEQAEIVANLRALTEQVIAGEVLGICVLTVSPENQWADDIFGEMDGGALHIMLHRLMIELAESIDQD